MSQCMGERLYLTGCSFHSIPAEVEYFLRAFDLADHTHLERR